MNNNSILPIILCGGSGARLWPLSRESFPKQYLKLLNEDNKTMVQITYERIEGLKNLVEPILICNEKHRFIIAEQFREIKIQPKTILLEPFGKNTCPAITLAALKAIESGVDPFLLILSSDHYISDKEILKEAISKGTKYCNEGKIITFGINPTSAETGYGYIKTKRSKNRHNDSAFEIEKFIEKPNLKQAREFIKDERFFWNSGIFLFKASSILSEINKNNPEILFYCQKSLEKNFMDLDFQRIDNEFFKKCPNLSIDVSVMEKTNLGMVIPLNTKWNDLGNWNSIWLNSKKNSDGNSIKGKVILKESKNSYLRSENRLMVGLGLENIIAIETIDAILICDQKHTQNIKGIVGDLKEKNILEGQEHKTIYRPWGSYTLIAEDRHWKVKKIIVNPKQSLSLQSHNFRSEHWVVVEGEAKVILDEKVFNLAKNESIYVPARTKHKLSNNSKKILILIEVQSGSYLGEDDIERFDDMYGRVNEY